VVLVERPLVEHRVLLEVNDVVEDVFGNIVSVVEDPQQIVLVFAGVGHPPEEVEGGAHGHW